ncbi:adenylate/guanylate cyclase domain-containing protein [Leptospira levettii]|uniref:Adenylate/guanylate cyclase domain-containing protein n=1 Tax=Leptospira paudalimensis TaxID=2950024 RepID=A0ABT3M2P2_9LEPT|nr:MULTISPECIES: adenylate/guanylate cyclase domain-containing protein [Leptospira]MCW7496583.1 adenylate/guanylate cyclase domain-containing protein [Leptospira levettii]MCW7502662.1 adenylate/guanylate cyclase domain-containing protein [Leptospira paudalimensis]
MKDAIVKQKFDTLKSFPTIKHEILKIAENFVHHSDDWKLLRVNPLKFATDHKLDENDSVDFFVHAAKVGLFDFAYNLICPMCGGIVHSHHKLDEIEGKEFHCVSCNIVVPTLLDDQVEVAFQIHPSLQNHQIDPFVDVTNYFRYFFSENFDKSTELKDWIQSSIKDYTKLIPDGSYSFEYDAKYGELQGHLIQFVSIDRNTMCLFSVDPNLPPNNQSYLVDLMESGMKPNMVTIPAGHHHFTIHNRTRFTVGLNVLTPNPKEIERIANSYPTIRHQFLTAKMLLNNQSFRDLFRIQKLSPDLNLNVKSLTIMFTDLKGSTEMYDTAGDIFAYKLVQEHFRILTEIVRKYKGAIVKTMGDAIMATFSTPTEGLLAALEMMRRIELMNLEWKKEGYEIGLKVGLNEGSALAVVNDERLDYFGQSVNIAARVQGLAKSGEVWLSESVWNATGPEDLVKQHGYYFRKQKATLKGVGTPVPVFQLSRNQIKAPSKWKLLFNKG